MEHNRAVPAGLPELDWNSLTDAKEFSRRRDAGEWPSDWTIIALHQVCRERQLSEVITEWTKRIRQVEELVIRANAAEAERDSLREQVERLTKERDRDRGSRVHTQKWYASHYGRLEDWARKVLPEPYRNQFFSCIANGTYDGMLDVGKPYMCKAGFMVTPSGYMHMDDAKGQLILDQTRRAEDAEAKLSSLQSQEAPEQAWERGFRTAQRMAASLCPWREHLARNPIAATLSSPGQCVEVKNKLILAQSVYPYVAPQESKSDAGEGR
jgi:hypothetical protein